jgi:transglutaminase-like putative cysteine protease
MSSITPDPNIRVPDAPVTEVGTTPPSLPMYLAALIVTGCGLFAATEYLADDAFSHLIYGLTILGFIVSFVSRQQNVSPRNIELPALIICACVFFTGLVSDQPFLAPSSIGDDRHRSLAVLLTWLTVFRSFTLINDGALLFCCVPTIALIGLISTNMTDESLIGTFVTFVAAASFMMVHENVLRTRNTARPMPRRSRLQGSIGSQLQVAGVCVAASVFLANILVVPLRNILNQVQISAGIPTVNRNSVTSTTVTPVAIAENQEVRIGNGPVSQSDQVVMRVQTSLEAPYWRGTTFNRYTGHGWRNELLANRNLETAQNSLPVDGGVIRGNSLEPRQYTFDIQPTGISGVRGPKERVKQHVALQGAAFEALYAAAEPRVLHANSAQGTYDDAGSIHLSSSTTSLEYDVESDVSTAGPGQLRKTTTDYPEEIRNLYLQLPTDNAMVERWRSAAKNAVTGATNPYDKVAALSRWIGNECKYNLKADAVPADQDVVDTFLFKAKQGYCDSFASSLAMLCRTLGIPARVASGFLTGESDPMKKEFVVRERDKHQWTEVYFSGVGWQKFDATEFAENITPEDGLKAEKGKSFFAFLFGRGWLPPLALAAFVAMLAYVLKVEVWDRLRGRKRTASALALPETNVAVIEQYDAACKSLARTGLRKRDSETAAEFQIRVEATLEAWPDARAQFDRLTALLVRSRYSGQEALAEDVRLARDAVANLANSLRSVRRRDLEAALAASEAGA